jgi:predicted O-methyltransferase YrrM
MVPLLEDILRTGQVRAVDGSRFLPVDSAITADVGEFLQRLIRQRKPKTTLEVGLAFGISALFICETLKECGGVRHIAIDPHQSTQWKGIGINNLKLAGFGNLIELKESYSHLALAEIEARGTTVEFAFIDGWHTFDHALTDFFHVDRILPVGGVVVFDDVFFPGVHQACRYVATNRDYRVVGVTEQVADYKPSNAARVIRQAGRVSAEFSKLLKAKFVNPDETLGFTPDCRCVAFEKVSDDNRGWADHRDF